MSTDAVRQGPLGERAVGHRDRDDGGRGLDDDRIVQRRSLQGASLQATAGALAGAHHVVDLDDVARCDESRVQTHLEGDEVGLVTLGVQNPAADASGLATRRAAEGERVELLHAVARHELRVLDVLDLLLVVVLGVVPGDVDDRVALLAGAAGVGERTVDDVGGRVLRDRIGGRVLRELRHPAVPVAHATEDGGDVRDHLVRLALAGDDGVQREAALGAAVAVGHELVAVLADRVERGLVHVTGLDELPQTVADVGEHVVQHPRGVARDRPLEGAIPHARVDARDRVVIGRNLDLQAIHQIGAARNLVELLGVDTQPEERRVRVAHVQRHDLRVRIYPRLVGEERAGRVVGHANHAEAHHRGGARNRQHVRLLVARARLAGDGDDGCRRARLDAGDANAQRRVRGAHHREAHAVVVGLDRVEVGHERIRVDAIAVGAARQVVAGADPLGAERLLPAQRLPGGAGVFLGLHDDVAQVRQRLEPADAGGRRAVVGQAHLGAHGRRAGRCDRDQIAELGGRGAARRPDVARRDVLEVAAVDRALELVLDSGARDVAGAVVGIRQRRKADDHPNGVRLGAGDRERVGRGLLDLHACGERRLGVVAETGQRRLVVGAVDPRARDALEVVLAVVVLDRRVVQVDGLQAIDETADLALAQEVEQREDCLGL